jgi:GntR family transcriptional regulator, transcriptional repressor for pyruvate dehydrogenase complex
MTDDAMISLLSAATRIACGRMTPQHLNALHASVQRASCLSARHDWELKVAAHAELFTMLGDLTGDCDLARLVSLAAGRLQDLVMTVGPASDGIILSSRRRLLRELRARDAAGAAREVERHLAGLHFMGRLACGAGSGRIGQASRAVPAELVRTHATEGLPQGESVMGSLA